MTMLFAKGVLLLVENAVYHEEAHFLLASGSIAKVFRNALHLESLAC